MRKTTIKIKRPEGHTEIINITDKFPGGISDPMFDQIKAATLKAGKGECLSYKIENIDERTQTEKDHSQIIGKAMSELYNAENASYSDPSRIIKARMALEEAQKEWAEKYPEEVEKEKAEYEREETEKHERIKNSAGYKAAIEGRD
jgi:uncharacterized secreted protein with C-terminal beta-propeller domain